MLGFRLSVIKREHAVGSFNVDLVGNNVERGDVIIENQLEQTNHDHLGKLLTYLANIGSKTAIWITSAPRPKHVRAVEWLNEITPADTCFFLIQLEAHRIDQGNPAPYFKVVVRPSEETKNFGAEKRELAEHQLLCREFWTQLLKRAKDKGFLLHSNRTTTKDMWIGGGAGKSGLSFNYVIWVDEKGAAELYIDTGEKRENKRIFDKLKSKKRIIEKAFGSKLVWERLDDRQASRVRVWVNAGGLQEKPKWPKIQDTLVETMRRLSNVLLPHIRNLDK